MSGSNAQKPEYNHRTKQARYTRACVMILGYCKGLMMAKYLSTDSIIKCIIDEIQKKKFPNPLKDFMNTPHRQVCVLSASIAQGITKSPTRRSAKARLNRKWLLTVDRNTSLDAKTIITARLPMTVIIRTMTITHVVITTQANGSSKSWKGSEDDSLSVILFNIILSLEPLL